MNANGNDFAYELSCEEEDQLLESALEQERERRIGLEWRSEQQWIEHNDGLTALAKNRHKAPRILAELQASLE